MARGAEAGCRGAGWRAGHALTLANLENEVAGYEKVHAEFPAPISVGDLACALCDA